MWHFSTKIKQLLFFASKSAQISNLFNLLSFVCDGVSPINIYRLSRIPHLHLLSLLNIISTQKQICFPNTSELKRLTKTDKILQAYLLIQSTVFFLNNIWHVFTHMNETHPNSWEWLRSATHLNIVSSLFFGSAHNVTFNFARNLPEYAN